MTKTLITVTDDPVVLRGAKRIASFMGLDFLPLKGFDALKQLEPPLAVVVDLEREGVMDALTEARSRWPKTLLAGYVSMPDAALWEAAEEAGCNLVSNRGGLSNQLQKKIQNWEEESGKQRLRLFSLKDIAGRLGMVKRLKDTPVGAVAIYHIGGVVYAAEDVCSHEQARLSDGEIDLRQKLITCPLHGSQFDVSTGERTRGPADLEIKTYRVIVEGTQVYLQTG